jgi:lycopene beta-cyclase
MRHFDYIITGSGAAGLILAYRMAKDSFFDDKSILLIDKDSKDKNDRTWCFWEQGAGEWDDILETSWNHIYFKSELYSEKLSIDPYVYKMIQSSKLYQKVLSEIRKKPNFTIVQDEVLNISHRTQNASVLTQKTEYHGKKVLNSIFFDREYKHQRTYPVLQQHFLGWFIETEEDQFDASAATFMDFTVEQDGNTRFMYILPESSRKALFEYTLFSPDLLTEEEYEAEIELYLKEKGITKYKIVEKEKGIIPMTSYKFWKYNSDHVMYIGTAGGWSKASTGYTFMNIHKKTKDLIEFLKSGISFKEFHKTNKFWWFDLLLLDVLYKNNELGSKIFAKLFQGNSAQKIFKFLDEETSIAEEIPIILSVPTIRFTKALFRRLL